MNAGDKTLRSLNKLLRAKISENDGMSTTRKTLGTKNNNNPQSEPRENESAPRPQEAPDEPLLNQQKNRNPLPNHAKHNGPLPNPQKTRQRAPGPHEAPGKKNDPARKHRFIDVTAARHRRREPGAPSR